MQKFVYIYQLIIHIILLDVTAAPIIVGCEANSECAQEEACLNGDCVDPCNCGRDAYCRVFQHTPLCYCPEGYSGNPEVACEKREFLYA